MVEVAEALQQQSQSYQTSANEQLDLTVFEGEYPTITKGRTDGHADTGTTAILTTEPTILTATIADADIPAIPITLTTNADVPMPGTTTNDVSIQEAAPGPTTGATADLPVVSVSTVTRPTDTSIVPTLEPVAKSAAVRWSRKRRQSTDQLHGYIPLHERPPTRRQSVEVPRPQTEGRQLRDTDARRLHRGLQESKRIAEQERWQQRISKGLTRHETRRINRVQKGEVYKVVKQCQHKIVTEAPTHWSKLAAATEATLPYNVEQRLDDSVKPALAAHKHGLVRFQSTGEDAGVVLELPVDVVTVLQQYPEVDANNYVAHPEAKVTPVSYELRIPVGHHGVGHLYRPLGSNTLKKLETHMAFFEEKGIVSK
eukprot:Lankesteria_metandrocarpae@DN2655_c0_g1_i1.p1